MELKQQYEMAKSLIPILHNYYATGRARIEMHEKENLRMLYSQLFLVTPDVNCQSCVVHYLNMLDAWIDSMRRQHSHLEETNTPVVEEQNIQPGSIGEEITKDNVEGGCSSCKQKKGVNKKK